MTWGRISRPVARSGRRQVTLPIVITNTGAIGLGHASAAEDAHLDAVGRHL